jgi:tetratricopeptide (TPR) repeat protein
MINGRKKLFFIMVAEKAGLDLDMTTAALAEITRANLKSVTGKVTFSEQEPLEVNGLKGIVFSGDATLRNQNLSYYYWVCSHNGYLYQLIASGATRYKAAVRKEGKKLFGNFEQLDPDKVIYTTDKAPYDSFTSQTFNYTVDLKNTTWRKWEDIETDFKEAETGGVQVDGSWFLVLSFYFGENEPSAEDFNWLMARQLNIEYPGKNILNLEPVKEKSMKGHRFESKLPLEGEPFHYHVKVLKGKTWGYMVAVGLPETKTEPFKEVKRVFDAVTFSGRKPFAGHKGKIDLKTMLPERDRDNHAHFYNGLGLRAYTDKQYTKCIPFFKTAVRLNPKDPVYIENTLSAYNGLNKYKEGLAYLETLPRLPAKSQDIRSWKAAFLGNLDREDEAIAVYEGLFAEDYKEDDDFIYYTKLLGEKEQWSKAEAAYESYLKKNDSLKLRLEQSRMLFRQEKYREAIKLLKEQQKGIAFNASIAYNLVYNYKALGEYKEGLKVCQQMIDKGLASRDAYYQKGKLEYYLKWYKETKQSFEKALSYAPDDKELKDDLKHISALLGEGDNSSVKNAIAAIKMPEPVKEKLPPLTAPSPQAGTSAYYISKVTGIRYKEGEPSKYTREHCIKVLNASGVSRFSTLEVDFSPLDEKVFVNVLEVRGKDGKVISRGKPSDFYVVDRQKGEMATHDQTLHIPVPHLVPGSTIRFIYTMEKLYKEEEFLFRSTPFSSSYPVVFSAQYIVGDVAKLVDRHSKDVRRESFDNGLLWYVENPVQYDWEPAQVLYSRILPMVRVNDNRLKWKKVGEDHLESIKEKMVTEPAVTALAARLIKGKQTKAAKMAALWRHMQEKYTYKAIEFGKRARIPNKGSKTIANKYGDCKDHAVLFQQLLKAAGIPSYLALVNLSDDVMEEMPSLDQFDHVIVYVPGEEGEKGDRGTFLDCTDKDLGLAVGVPANLAKKHALVLNPANIRLENIPGYPAGSSTMAVKRDITVQDPAKMKVRESVTLGGYSASFMREYLKMVETRKQDEWAYRLMSRYLDTWELKQFRVKDLKDNSKPLVMELEYVVTGTLKTPNAWETYYLEVSGVKERKTPFKIEYPFRLTSRGTVQAAPGIKMEIAKDPAAPGKEQEPYAGFQSSRKVSSRRLDLDLECTLTQGEYKASSYSPYVKMMNRASKAMTVEIKCRKKKP